MTDRTPTLSHRLTNALLLLAVGGLLGAFWREVSHMIVQVLN